MITVSWPFLVALVFAAALGVAGAVVVVTRAEQIAQRFADRILSREFGKRSTLPIAELWDRDPVGTRARHRRTRS